MTGTVIRTSNSVSVRVESTRLQDDVPLSFVCSSFSLLVLLTTFDIGSSSYTIIPVDPSSSKEDLVPTRLRRASDPGPTTLPRSVPFTLFVGPVHLPSPSRFRDPVFLQTVAPLRFRTLSVTDVLSLTPCPSTYVILTSTIVLDFI